jgi:hypothetical protein
MSTVTRTTNPNGTYRYELDGKVIYKASRVLYTHATHYTVAGSTPVLFHKTEAAARKATGYAGWTKTSTDAIVDGDAAPGIDAEISAIGQAVAETLTADHPAIEAAMQRKSARAAQLDAAPADAPQAPACGHCAAHPGWAHGDTTRRVEPRDVCGVCLGSGTPVPPERRRAPRNGVRVRVNTEYPGQAYKGMTGKVHSKVTGDDGVRYVMVDFQGRTWPFQIHELDVI